MHTSPTRMRRRTFLHHAIGAAFAFPFVSRLGAASANGLIRHASFGAAGMAGADLNAIVGTGKARLVAVADVDLNRTSGVRTKYPEARIYQDWRRLLDKEADQIDAANVSTPDHMHGPIGMALMQLGKHAYIQKPLAHNLHETRQLTLQAQKAGVATQMGIQVHSSAEYRLAVELVRNLVVGKIKEVHAWSNKKWGDMSPRPDRSDPVPEGLDWNLWLGVAQPRPFIKDYYHPGNWRKRIDFGTGTFGDMGCHIYDPVFKALDLTAPLSVRSEGPKPGRHNWAINALIRYVFPGTPYTHEETVRVTWYDGDQRPPRQVADLLGGRSLPGQGSVFIGTKGVMLLPHVGRPVLLPEENFAAYDMPDVTGTNHWRQFVDACLGEGTTSASLDYSGPLTETVLLGSLATRFPDQTLRWNRKSLSFDNSKQADAFVRRSYRPGWEPRWV